MTIEVDPCDEVALIESIPLMVGELLDQRRRHRIRHQCRATRLDKVADTLMVGNSVRGSAATGR